MKKLMIWLFGIVLMVSASGCYVGDDQARWHDHYGYGGRVYVSHPHDWDHDEYREHRWGY